MSEQVWVYARGSDRELREACGELLIAGHVSWGDLLSAATIKLNKRDEPNVGAVGRAVVLVAPRDKLELVFERLRFHVGDELCAYALPVLASTP